MNQNSLNELLSLMEEQVKLMADLTALSKKKSQLLVDGNMEQLDIVLRGEQALIWHMGRLEERRYQMQLNLAAQLGIHPNQLTLERLVTYATPEHAHRCESIAREYGQSASELSQVNQLNTELIQQAMAYVDFSLQLLGASAPAAGGVYSPKGPRSPEAKHRRLDNRV